MDTQVPNPRPKPNPPLAHRFGPLNDPVANGKKSQAKHTRPETQITLMQQVAFRLSQDPKTSPSAVAQLLKSWDVLEERKRIRYMKPRPKDIDVDPRNDPRNRLRKPLRLAQIVDSAVDQVIDVPAVPGQPGQPGQPVSEPEPGGTEPEPGQPDSKK